MMFEILTREARKIVSTEMEAQVERVLGLIQEQTSADNNVRRSAELAFNQLVGQDPTGVCYVLIQVPMETSYSIEVRQSCLLHLRRLVPKYWSMAFDSFTGLPISQDLKKIIRDNLIELVVRTADSKIRNSASYAIVQIAAADYPDEWPELLSVLYSYTTNFDDQLALEGSLKVLNDLFDDLVTDEQFWDDNVGSQIIGHISNILSKDTLNAAIKTNCVELYKSVLNYLVSPEAFNNESRRKMVTNHLPFICTLFYDLSKSSVQTTYNELANNTLDIVECKLRSTIYGVLSSIVGTFNKKLSLDFKRYMVIELVTDLNTLVDIYTKVLNQDVDFSVSSDDLLKDITDLLNELIGLLTLLQHTVSLTSIMDDTQYVSLVNKVISVTCLPLLDSYENDLNVYVSENTGLAGFIAVRDTLSEFFSDLNSKDSNRFFDIIVKQCQNPGSSSWDIIEAKLYLIESMFLNEDAVIDAKGYLSFLFNFFTHYLILDDNNQLNPNYHPLVIARLFLLLPKFLDKFEGKIDGIENYKNLLPNYNNNPAGLIFSLSIHISSNIKYDDPGYDFVKAAALISCSSYLNSIDFSKDFNESEAVQTQQNIFKLISSLVDEGEDDTLATLLEALSVGIDINQRMATKSEVTGSFSVVNLILSIAFKDPSNIQTTSELSDCLKTLFSGISLGEYVTCCEKSLPLLLNNIKEVAAGGQAVEFSPKLDVSLELLNIIIEAVPPNEQTNEKEIPDLIFGFIYPTLKNMLVLANDDQILQNGGAVFNSLIQNASHSFSNYKDPLTNETGMQSLLTLVSKFLSPDLSDRAAMNCGTIVTSLINRFQRELGDDFLSQILSATAQRLLIAKEVITIENLVMLFCNLVLLSPENMIDYLGNLKLRDPKTGEDKTSLSLILPIWFQSFEVTRGYEKIKLNALALGKIFSLADQRIENLVVDGDLIPYDGDKILTRSMTKTMPDRYTQVSASLKIIKLLVSELEFQCQQPSNEDYIQSAGAEAVDGEVDDDDGWEDLDDMGVSNYEQLKSYIDSDDEGEVEDSKDADLKNLLVQFFKECAARNLGHFLKYYDLLSDDEKTIINENVLF